jgi:hypothetical protein
MPRHPPCALKNLNTTRNSKRCSRPLCSSQNTNGTNPPTTTTPHRNPAHKTNETPTRRPYGSRDRPARPQPHPPNQTGKAANAQTGDNRHHNNPAPVPSGPNSVPDPHHRPPRVPEPTNTQQAVLTKQPNSRNRIASAPPTSKPTHKTHAHGMSHGPPPPNPHQKGTQDSSSQSLLRKEVIQPHLPVRLPCYDFVPIAGPTFDGSPHKG